MPTFEDSDQGIVSDQPSSHQSMKAAEKSSNKQSCHIRRRPPGISGPFRLCRYHDRPELCRQGKLCLYAHSEAERIAWEEDRKKGILSLTLPQVRKSHSFFFFLHKVRKSQAVWYLVPEMLNFLSMPRNLIFRLLQPLMSVKNNCYYVQ